MKEENLFNKEELKDGQHIVRICGAVFDPKIKKILLGKREDDPYIEGLTWCLPGGRPKKGEKIEECLKRSIKEKTNLGVANLGPIFARIHEERPEFLTITYLCEPVEGEIKAGEKFVEVKWVNIEALKDLDTAIKVHPEVIKYLEDLK
jgi:ADP-ribose pyrophosphatase YjhB (NUDIX family)